MAECGGRATKIDGDVEDLPTQSADEFALGLLDLVVEAPDDSGLRAGEIILHEIDVDAGLGEPAAVEQFLEEAAIVGEDAGLDEDEARELAGSKIHGWSLRVACQR